MTTYTHKRARARTNTHTHTHTHTHAHTYTRTQAHTRMFCSVAALFMTVYWNGLYNNCPTRCNTKQCIYYSASSLYMFRVSTAPIIRSTLNCTYCLRYWSATSLQIKILWRTWFKFMFCWPWILVRLWIHEQLDAQLRYIIRLLL